MRSFRALARVDIGMDIERVATFQLELPMATYPAQPARDAFFAQLLDRVASLPGVTAATMASGSPVEEQPAEQSFTRAGSADVRTLLANFQLVAPGYFSLLGRMFRPMGQPQALPMSL